MSEKMQSKDLQKLFIKEIRKLVKTVRVDFFQNSRYINPRLAVNKAVFTQEKKWLNVTKKWDLLHFDLFYSTASSLAPRQSWKPTVMVKIHNLVANGSFRIEMDHHKSLIPRQWSSFELSGYWNSYIQGCLYLTWLRVSSSSWKSIFHRFVCPND